MIPRTYAIEGDRQSGRITITHNGRAILIPALRWLPPQEITRAHAAEILRRHRKDGMKRRLAYHWEENAA